MSATQKSYAPNRFRTAGISLMAAGAIAVVPAVSPLAGMPLVGPGAHHGTVALAAGMSDLIDPYVDLWDHTSANLAALTAGTGMNDLLTQIFTHPEQTLGNLPELVHLLTQALPQIDFGLLPLPAHLSTDLPPLLSMTLAGIGPGVAVVNAMQDIFSRVTDFSDPWAAFVALLTAPAVLLDALLNGHAGITVGGLDIPLFNGLLVPEQSFDLDIDLGQVVGQLGLGGHTITDLLDSFGIGDTSLASLLTSLLDTLGYGEMTPVELLDQVGIGTQSVASLLSGVLDNLGYGDMTVVGALDQLGVGSEPLSDLAGSLLSSLGIDGDSSIADLLNDQGIGDGSVAQLLSQILDVAGVGNPTIVELFENQLGMGDLTIGGLLTDLVGNQTVTDLAGPLLDGMTVGDIATQVLDSAGIGQQTAGELVLQLLGDQFGITPNTGFGDLLITILQDPSIDMDLTLNEAVAESGMGDTTLGELVTTMGIADEPFKSLIPGSILNTPICDLQSAVSGTICGFALGDQSLNDWLGNNSVLVTMQNLMSDHGVPLADKTLADVVAATGMGNEHLSEIIDNLHLNNTIGDILNTLGFNDVSITDAVVGGLGLDNVTVLDLLGDWGLDNLPVSQVIADLGLNNVYVVDLLSDLNLDNLDVDTVLDRLFGDVPVNDILNGLGLDQVSLNDVLDDLLSGTTLSQLLTDIGFDDVPINDALDSLLGGVTLGSVLGDLGLNDIDLNTVIGGLGLDDVTVNSLLGNLGLGDLSLATFLSNLGIGDTAVFEAHIGNLFGLLTGWFDTVPGQIADVLGS